MIKGQKGWKEINYIDLNETGEDILRKDHPGLPMKEEPLFLGVKPGSPMDIISKQMDFLYEQGKKIAKDAIDHQDEEVELQVQRELEKDMYIRSDEYTEEELDRAEARGESAWDAHKEECPEVEHEKCF